MGYPRVITHTVAFWVSAAWGEYRPTRKSLALYARARGVLVYDRVMRYLEPN